VDQPRVIDGDVGNEHVFHAATVEARDERREKQNRWASVPVLRQETLGRLLVMLFRETALPPS
jgi:hypothetical protein